MMENSTSTGASEGNIDGGKVVRSGDTFATIEDKAGNSLSSGSGAEEMSKIDESEELPWWFPHFRGKPIFYGNLEAFGWVIEAIGRSIAVMSASAFLATIWLNKVKLAAGCEIDVDEDGLPEVCNGRVYGFKPSSLLTMYTVFISIVSCVLMPLFGAVVDYTPHRRLMGRWFSAVLAIFLIPTIFVDELKWEITAAAFVVMTATSWGETVVCNAYVPELTEDESVLNYFTAMFVIIPFGCVVLFLSFVVGVAYALGIHENDGATAKLAQTISFLVTVVFLGVSWGFFLKKRPPKHQLQPGKKVWVEGFKQIYRSSVDIYNNYHVLKWFYIANA